MREADFNGLMPVDGREAHFYTLLRLRGGNFNRVHLENTRSVLGAVVLDGHGIVDAQIVEGDVTNPVPRGEVLVDHQLTAEELKELADGGTSTKDGPLDRAAA